MQGSDQKKSVRIEEQKVNISPAERRARIKALNDRLRRTGEGGRQYFTPGICELGLTNTLIIRKLVAEYDGFCEDNDPYGEHDFGNLVYAGEKVFWKIDYYDKGLKQGSPDPSDPTVTTRVLTIFLAREY